MRRRGARRLAVILAVLMLPALPVAAQTEPPGTVAATLAAGELPSVVDMPLFMRLYEARLPAQHSVSYEGSSLLLYDLQGAAVIAMDDREALELAEGGGAFIPAGRTATIRANGGGPADLLLFLLTARPNQRRPLLDRPAVVREMFRTPEPLPGLQPGPYEFTLTRVTVPAGGASGAYSRSGAALDYVLEGTAALTAEGKTASSGARTPLFERFGWVHRLSNPGAAPLVLLQANISQQGARAVQPVGSGG